jgi:hypothetical protein
MNMEVKRFWTEKKEALLELLHVSLSLSLSFSHMRVHAVFSMLIYGKNLVDQNLFSFDIALDLQTHLLYSHSFLYYDHLGQNLSWNILVEWNPENINI